jgi:hypothetical protein
VTESGGHQAASETASGPEYGIPYSTYDLCAAAYYSGTWHRRRENNVAIQSYSSAVKKTLALPSSGSETGSNRKCP